MLRLLGEWLAKAVMAYGRIAALEAGIILPDDDA